MWFENYFTSLILIPTRRRSIRRSPPAAQLRVEVLEDRRLLSLTPSASIAMGGISASADFNNDGRADLVAVSGGNVVTALGNGNGTFAAPQTSTIAPPTAASLAVGDFNSDGMLDLATGHYDYYSYNNYYGTGDHDVSILFGNGDGTFDSAVPLNISAWGPSWKVASGDFDGDGRPDLVVAENGVPGGFGGEYVRVLRGNGDGSFTLASTQGPISNGFYPVELYTPVLADFNGDGNADVAVPAGTAGKGFVKVFLGNGDGTLQPPRDITTYSTTYWGTTHSVTAGDFNSDSRLDMATLNDNGTESILLGNGDGTFQSAQHVVTGQSGVSLTAVDLSGDGALDLVMSAGGIVSVQLGNGSGSFAPPLTIAAGYSFVVADFNNDNLPDAAVWNSGTGLTSVLLNDGVWPAIAPLPQISINDVTKNEGNSRTTNFTFTITLSAASAQAVSVNYATANVTAASGSDYQSKTGTVTFAPGQTSKTITVLVNGDKQREANEGFFVNLSGAIGGVITDSQGVGTILNDDGSVKSKRSSFAFAVDAAIDDWWFPVRKRRSR